MNMQRIINEPRPGCFKIRTRKGGPWQPAKIYHPCECDGTHHEVRDDCTRFPPMIAIVNGEETSVETVWLYGRPITQEEYDAMKPATETLAERDPVF